MADAGKNSIAISHLFTVGNIFAKKLLMLGIPPSKPSGFQITTLQNTFGHSLMPGLGYPTSTSCFWMYWPKSVIDIKQISPKLHQN